MTKEVLIRLSGLQMIEEAGKDHLEMITTGDYFRRNGKHFIIYNEMIDGMTGTVRNTVKITPETMDIRKQGVTNAHMIFEQDKKNLTRYATPMGDLMVGINTNRISIEEEEDRLNVSVEYSLDINYEHVSECNITMEICSKEKADLRLS